MKNYNKTMYYAGILVALSGVLYGFLGYLGTHILREHISISSMLFWRFLIAGSWITLFTLKKNSPSYLFAPIEKRMIFVVFILGTLGYAGASQFYFIASQYTGTGLAMVIFFSYPIILACISWILDKQPISTRTLFTFLAMVIGLLLLQNSSDNHFNFLGITFGVIAAICYAVYVIGSKRFISNLHSSPLTAIVCFGCTFIFLISSIASHSFTFPHLLKTWVYLLVLGIFATALPIQLMLEGLKYVSSLRASIISVLEPIVTVLIGVLLLEESISYLQIIGALVIVLSALSVQYQREL